LAKSAELHLGRPPPASTCFALVFRLRLLLFRWRSVDQQLLDHLGLFEAVDQRRRLADEHAPIQQRVRRAPVHLR
jgi:hypothetical protein